MFFKNFLSLIPEVVNTALPGETAHAKMSPPKRKALIQNLDTRSANPRRAAVLMLIYPENDLAHLVLIRRNSYKGVHSSQIAFPGGKIESFDESPIATALRETHEEIGVNPISVSIVCPFSEVYIPPSNFLVAPFLGYCLSRPDFVPDPREVVETISLPLSILLDESTVVMNRMATSYSTSIEVPVFEVGEDAVWGATAMMLSELKEVLKTACA